LRKRLERANSDLILKEDDSSSSDKEENVKYDYLKYTDDWSGDMEETPLGEFSQI